MFFCPIHHFFIDATGSSTDSCPVFLTTCLVLIRCLFLQSKNSSNTNIQISRLIHEILEQTKNACPIQEAAGWTHLLFLGCSKYMFWSREEGEQFLSSLILIHIRKLEDNKTRKYIPRLLNSVSTICRIWKSVCRV